MVLSIIEECSGRVQGWQAEQVTMRSKTSVDGIRGSSVRTRIVLKGFKCRQIKYLDSLSSWHFIEILSFL